MEKKSKKIKFSGLFMFWFLIFSFCMLLAVSMFKFEKSHMAFYKTDMLVSSDYTVDAQGRFTSQKESAGFSITNGIGMTKLNGIVIRFGENAKKNRKLFVKTKSVSGKEKTFQGIWKKGTKYCQVPVSQTDYTVVKINIIGSFSLENVELIYRKEGMTRVQATLLGEGVALVLALIFAGMEKGIVVYEKARLQWISIITTWREKRKKLLRNGVVAGGLAVLAWGICPVMAYLLPIKESYRVWVTLYAVLLAVVFWVIYRKEIVKKIEVAAFLFILLTGTMYTLVMPHTVGVSWDDQIHYEKVLGVMNIQDGYRWYSDYDLIANASVMKEYFSASKGAEYKQYLKFYDDRHCLGNEIGRSLSAADAAYIPSVIGCLLARALWLPNPIIFLVGRWMNVLFWACIVYFSMKRLQYGKIVPFLIGMIPTNLFLCASYTYDIWLTGWLMLGLCYFFGEIQQKQQKLSKEAFLMIPLSVFLALLPKGVYFPIGFLALFMPKKKFVDGKQRRNYYILLSGAMILPFALAMLPRLFQRNIGTDSRGGEEVNGNSQVQFLLQNPIKGMGIIGKFLISYLIPINSGAFYLTNVAYIGIAGNYHAEVLTLGIGALLDREQEEEKIFPWWYKLGTLLVYIGVGAIVALSMYIVFTPVGANTIAGCQGRYLLPLCFPVVFVLSRVGKSRWFKDKKGLYYTMFLVMLANSIYPLIDTILKM